MTSTIYITVLIILFLITTLPVIRALITDIETALIILLAILFWPIAAACIGVGIGTAILMYIFSKTAMLLFIDRNKWYWGLEK